MDTFLQSYTNLWNQAEQNRERLKKLEIESINSMCKLLEEICEQFKDKYIIFSQIESPRCKKFIIGKIISINRGLGYEGVCTFSVNLGEDTITVEKINGFEKVIKYSSKLHENIPVEEFLRTVKTISKEQFNFLSMNFISIVDVVESKILYI